MDTATATSQPQLSDPLPRRAGMYCSPDPLIAALNYPVADGRCQPDRNFGLALCLFILPTEIHSQVCLSPPTVHSHAH